LSSLVCPRCFRGLIVNDGTLVDSLGHRFPIRSRVPRFVDSAGYTENFSLQWNRFSRTQLDSQDNTLSSQRFWAETGWSRVALNGVDVLEVGSGAGRFSRVLLAESKARLFSIDYSESVTANLSNNSYYVDNGRLVLAQASIYDLPFTDNSFDYAFCLGVLQHTPDFKDSLRCLIDKLSPGGQLVVDFYPINGWWTKISAKYLLRPLLKRLSPKMLLQFVRLIVPVSIIIYKVLTLIGLNKATRFLPICDIDATLPSNLSKEQLIEWCVLDTFDMFSPRYDHPQRIETVAKWVNELGADVTFAGFVDFADSNRAAVVRAVKRRPNA